jgi:hypothetical protein
MKNWITESEYKEASKKANEILANWSSNDSNTSEDNWVSIKVGAKVFDLNIWTEAKDWNISVHPTKINESGQLETIGTDFIKIN